MSRSGISEPELHAIRTVLAGNWRAPRPENELRRALAWFPDADLLRWFEQGDGCGDGEVQALSLEEALEWRRQLLLRDLPSPLSSADRFLPLVRCEVGFLIYDGKARGLALRRTKQPERYADALKWPLRLSALLESAPLPRLPPLEEPEDDEELPQPVVIPLEQHFTRVFGAPVAPMDLERLAPLCETKELRAWFSRVGPSSRKLLSDLSAFSFPDALVCRDQLEGGASADLQAQLHHLSWMPLLELPGRHAVIYWKNSGVRLHAHHEGAWQASPWSRLVSFETFLAALSAWAEPRLPQHEDPAVILDKLWGVADAWEGDPPERDVDSSRLSAFSAPIAHALEAWLSQAPEPPFTEAKERLMAADSLEPGQPIAPLLRGEDGFETCVIDGLGIVLRCGEARLPWAPSITEWTTELDHAAARRGKPGVTVTRNIVGHYRLELPLLPYELARRIERLTADQPEVLDPNEFTIALGDDTGLHVERFSPTLVLDEHARDDLVAALDGLREPELSCLEVTFIFKPLRG